MWNPLPFQFNSLIYVYVYDSHRQKLRKCENKSIKFCSPLLFFWTQTHTHTHSCTQNVCIEPNTDDENGIDAFLKSVWYDAETHQFKCDQQQQKQKKISSVLTHTHSLSLALSNYFLTNNFFWTYFDFSSVLFFFLRTLVLLIVWLNVSIIYRRCHTNNNTEIFCACVQIQNDA